jgi:hypothetical protein
MPTPRTPRQEAEAILAFGEELAALVKEFDRHCAYLTHRSVWRIEQIAHQEHLNDIAAAFKTLGDQMCGECDAAEEAEDRRRDNPLEPDFRRLGQ